MRVVLAALAALGLCMGTSVQPASAAGFDGKWIADIPAQGRCASTGTMTMVVAGDAISGQVQNAGNVAPLAGKIDADGNATFTTFGRYPGTMKFSGDHFDATWNNGACDRHAEGNRALNKEQAATQSAQRKQHQDAYAELVRRAEAGDKTVDYTALRAESVYAEHWDFYDQKVNGLVAQASAAVKGKDCAGAMDKLDQVVKLDFTVDAAHSLKAECLRNNGDHDRARIESAIADGLVHSLMDSGKGDREQNAYVVNTMREEMDVLANRHIQIKTRQTEVRGSNGRYYDLIQGISVYYGIQSKNVYFDVTSFVDGRASRRAMVQTVADTVH